MFQCILHVQNNAAKKGLEAKMKKLEDCNKAKSNFKQLQTKKEVVLIVNSRRCKGEGLKKGFKRDSTCE